MSAPAGQVSVAAVELRDFRTYTRAQARLGPGLTVVHGPNGAGKSNLLESVYYGCTGRSPRTRNERELVRFGAQATRVRVELDGAEGEHILTVAFGAVSGEGRAEKRMTCDGAPVERLGDVPFRPLIGVFMPERMELVKGPPAVRRAHLDQLVAALWPPRIATRREYSRILAQRNALLARVRSGAASRSSIETWDRELARVALALRADRSAAAEMLSGPFSRRAEGLGCAGELTVEYRPGARAGDEEEFCAELCERLDADLDRGHTLYGAHRDDLALRRDGRELRVYGSQGEQRAALLALLLAERDTVASERGRLPLMLLDDVMSELDPPRRERLSEELRGAGQSLLATTDLAHVPGSADDSVTRLRVAPGALEQEALAA